MELAQEKSERNFLSLFRRGVPVAGYAGLAREIEGKKRKSGQRTVKNIAKPVEAHKVLMETRKEAGKAQEPVQPHGPPLQ
jgi:hypothetical protein